MNLFMETITKPASQTLSDTIDIGLLDLEKAKFFVTPGGFLGLKYGDKEYLRVTLRRALPVGKPMEYISVADQDNKEIGMISSVHELSETQRDIVNAELNTRYYCPIICEVKSVKDKLGYVYFELTLSRDGQRYEKTCTVKDISKNIRTLSDDRLILFDVDGNRYIVPALHGLDKKSQRRLEPYLF